MTKTTEEMNKNQAENDEKKTTKGEKKIFLKT